jgi:hypothetical protein
MTELEQMALDLGVERDIIVRMPPRSERQVRVIVLYEGRAKPHDHKSYAAFQYRSHCHYICD